LVKIETSSGDKEKFDSKKIEYDLKADGMPKRVAEEVAERIEAKVQDGWSTSQITEQVAIEIKRLKEDTDRAFDTYKQRLMTAGSTGYSSIHKDEIKRPY
jgi:hypothetical protein